VGAFATNSISHHFHVPHFHVQMATAAQTCSMQQMRTIGPYDFNQPFSPLSPMLPVQQQMVDQIFTASREDSPFSPLPRVDSPHLNMLEDGNHQARLRPNYPGRFLLTHQNSRVCYHYFI
jgi:hypothetical protein